MVWRNPNYLKEWRKRNKKKCYFYCKKWAQRNREKINRAKRKWRRANPEKEREYKEKYWTVPGRREKAREYYKEYYRKNKERKKQYTRQWKKNNPEKCRHQWRVKRIRKKNAKGNHTLEEWQDLKKKFNYTCPHCGRKEPEIKLTEDHIIPLSKGGTDYIKNIQPLCGSCNKKKYNSL